MGLGSEQRPHAGSQGLFANVSGSLPAPMEKGIPAMLSNPRRTSLPTVFKSPPCSTCFDPAWRSDWRPLSATEGLWWQPTGRAWWMMTTAFLPPHSPGLSEILGLENEETDILYPDESIQVTAEDGNPLGLKGSWAPGCTVRRSGRGRGDPRTLCGGFLCLPPRADAQRRGNRGGLLYRVP